MTSIARSNRFHIAVFGRRNAGKSSLVNCIAGQSVSIVSDVAGTTTDTVWKNIELPGVGAAVIADTAGFDDEGVLGTLRVAATRKVLERADVAILLLGDGLCDCAVEKEWYDRMCRLQLPVVVVAGKCDTGNSAERMVALEKIFDTEILSFSAVTGEGSGELLARLAQCCKQDSAVDDVTHSLVGASDMVVLVMPQDASAPKGRLIMPQVQTLRNLLDKHCIPLCCAPEELQQLLQSIVAPPKLIITDSQVFATVEKLVPAGTMLTSFSVLMARMKGDIAVFVDGAKRLLELSPGSRVLIAEACSHIPQNEDIGRVKLPSMLRGRFGDDVCVDVVSGNDFPDNLDGYDLVIHCGACMFTRRHVMARVAQAVEQGVPITNYGIAIAALTGVLDRVVY
ncbi:MAG: [Bacteroidaceae bacterium]|nr:[FeFe] hydrogenase H-cluster maturation GTPase HydF [Bacteroidaceae bacterium]